MEVFQQQIVFLIQAFKYNKLGKYVFFYLYLYLIFFLFIDHLNYIYILLHYVKQHDGNANDDHDL